MQLQSQKALLGIAMEPWKYTDNEQQQTALREAVIAIFRIENESENAKVSKFNIWNYVAKDKMRPQMCGVFYDKGYRVASDSRILIAVKDGYSEANDGRVQYKDGHFYDEVEQMPVRYPKWRDVIQIPESLNRFDWMIPFDAWEQAKKQYKTDSKVNGKTAYIRIKGGKETCKDSWSGAPVERDSSIYLAYDYFDKLMSVCKFIGADSLIFTIKGYNDANEPIWDSRANILASTDKGYALLCRCVNVGEDATIYDL